METRTKLVDFSFCKTCKYLKTKEEEEPCNGCLAVPAREDGSKKPVNYDEESAKKSRKKHTV